MTPWDLAVEACRLARHDLEDSGARLLRKIAAGAALDALPRESGRRTSSDHPTSFQAACREANIHRDTAYRWIALSRVSIEDRDRYVAACAASCAECSDAGLLKFAASPEESEDRSDARANRLRLWLEALAPVYGVTKRDELIFEIVQAAYKADLQARGVSA